jgi:four helix bundle protein
MPPEQLRARTRAFAVAGANYRAACRPKSDADFVSTLGTALEEADESAYWLELLVEADIVTAAAVKELYREADELTRIFVASRATAQRNARARALRRTRGVQN